MSGKSPNQSLENALDLLELLLGGPALRSGEIAVRLGLRPNTANNMVRLLYRRGYLSQDREGRYRPGPQCFFLGQGDELFRGLRAVALPFLLQLSGRTGDNAFLGIERDGRLYMVAHAEGTNVVRASEPQRWQRLIHCTAAGKIILAEYGLNWLKRVSGNEPLACPTPQVAVTDEALEETIARIRALGYSECVDEAAEGIHALGVAVRRPDGMFAGALSQSFPSYFVREGQVDIEERLCLLREYSRELGQAFGDDGLRNICSLED